MAKFRNDSPHDVYVDLGSLLLVRPGEVIDLVGALSCPPLTLLREEVFSRETPIKKKLPRKTKSRPVSGTI